MENKEKENEIEMTAREIASEVKSILLSDPDLMENLTHDVAMKLKQKQSYNNPIMGMGMNMGMSGMDMSGIGMMNPMSNGKNAFLEIQILNNEFFNFKESLIKKYGKTNGDFKDDLTKFESRHYALVVAWNKYHNF